MINPLKRTSTLDLSSEELPPSWIRRFPTSTDPNETPMRGVWRTGPQLRFRGALVDGLNAAREVALVSSFLLSDTTLAEAMRRAADRGVRVYALTASKQRLGKVLGEDDDFDRKMAEEHEKLLDGLAGRVLLRSADHLHAKFLVIDPGPTGRAWLSTANFNKGLGDNIELGVELDADAASSFATHFQWAFWREADQELRAPGRLVAVKPAPGEPRRPDAMGAVHATLKDGTALRDAVLATIGSARRELLIASYGLDAGHASVQAILDARRRNVEVTVLTRPRKVVAQVAALLAASGVRVVGHDKLHAKAIVADGQALVMTANLEPHGLDRGFELGVRLPSATARGVEETLREWSRTFPWEYRPAARRGEHLGDILLADGGLKEGGARVVVSVAVALPAVVAADALQLDGATPPAFVAPKSRAEYPQRVIFSWEIQAPALPKDARERLEVVEREEPGKDGKPQKVQEKRSYKPRVFERGREVFVKLENAADADLARSLATRLGGVVVA